MDTRPLLIAFAVAALALAQPVLAKTNAKTLWLDDQQLYDVFDGEKIAGHYPNGDTFTEDYNTDGTLEYIEDRTRRQITGQWSITAGTFCTIYDRETTGGCYQVSRVGANCFEFYFIARTHAQATIPEDRTKPRWTARAWLRAEKHTCEDESFV